MEGNVLFIMVGGRGWSQDSVGLVHCNSIQQALGMAPDFGP